MMGLASPQGLTVQDFHHQSFVNPLDVFPTKARLATRSQNYRSPIRNQGTSRSSSHYRKEQHNFACCDEDEEIPAFRTSNAIDCCVDFNCESDDLVNFDQPSPICCDEPHHSSPSPMDCDDCEDDCDDCVEEHLKAIQKPCNYVDEECEDCNDESTIECPDGPACQDMCDECDFSCFDCVDWTEFERDKNLGLHFSVPLLGGNGFTEPSLPASNTDLPLAPSYGTHDTQFNVSVPPLDVPMHHQCFSNNVPYWSMIAPEQICTGTPGLEQQLPLPPFLPNFGCHPAVAHQQSLQQFPQLADPFNLNTASNPQSLPISTRGKSKDALDSTQDLLSAVIAPSTSRSCQWLMPCGTVCGASFATGTDLKKHLKTIHLTKGVTKCSWQDCDAADFASEAALMGHISKKHLAAMLTSSVSTTPHKHHKHTHEGPFKCTFPDCPKSFTYKHIRDEHVATHHGGNKMYCPICKVYLNGEGSNFKRHMATHRPKHQHSLCKYHGLGCKKRFPRLDNLRRHEMSCKFGKKAKAEGVVVDGMHHHHHRHVHA